MAQMIKKSIFDGNSDMIHRALGLGVGQHLKQKSTCMNLDASSANGEVVSRLVEDLRNQTFSNWAGRLPSQENWRAERQTAISPKNKSPEVVLERAIAIASERGGLGNWYNQVPVASGMIDGTADKRAAVDLIQVQDRQVDLVELKWVSDTPAFAAFEILQYGLAYLLSRDKLDIFGYRAKELMQSEHVSLQVLAPAEFYTSYELGFLADGITRGLERLCLGRDDGLTMSFGFLSFPPGFRLPFSRGGDLLRHREEPIDTGANRYLIEAMNNLQPVWVTGAV